MVSIEFGTESDFDTSGCVYVTSAALDADHLIMGYRKGGTGYVRIGTCSGNTITGWGTAVSVGSIGNEGIQISTLSATSVVIAYVSAGDGFVKVGTVSGTTITFPTAAIEFNYDNPSTNYISLDAMSATYFIVAYEGDPTGITLGSMRICSISGTTITLGSVYTFNNGDTDNICVKALGSYYYIVAYRDVGGDTYGHYKIGQMSGRTNYGTGGEATFNSANTEYISLDATTPTTMLVAYRDTGGSGHGCAKGITRSGSTTSIGAENIFNSTTTDYVCVAGLSDNHFVIAYRDVGGSDYGCARLAVLSGNTIVSYSTEVEFNIGNTQHLTACGINSKYFGIGYYDVSGVDTTAIIGNIVFDFVPQIFIT